MSRKTDWNCNCELNELSAISLIRNKAIHTRKVFPHERGLIYSGFFPTSLQTGVAAPGIFQYDVRHLLRNQSSRAAQLDTFVQPAMDSGVLRSIRSRCLRWRLAHRRQRQIAILHR